MTEKRKPVKPKSLYQKVEELPVFWVMFSSILLALIFGSLGLYFGPKLITKYRPPTPPTMPELKSASGIITLIKDPKGPILTLKTADETYKLEGEKAQELLKLQGEKIQIDGFITEKTDDEKYNKLQIQEYFHLKIDETTTAETVSMSGTVQPLGISMFMQGTHTLNDDAGEIIALLEASDDKLKLAEGTYVEVTGTVEMSVEGELPFIRVDKITFR